MHADSESESSIYTSLPWVDVCSAWIALDVDMYMANSRRHLRAYFNREEHDCMLAQA